MNLTEDKLKSIKSGVQAFLITWALQLLLGITVRNLLTVVTFGAAFLCLKNLKKPLINPVVPVVVSGVLTAVSVKLSYARAAASFSSGLFKALTAVIMAAGFFVLLYRAAEFLCGKITGVKETDTVPIGQSEKMDADKMVLPGGGIVILICSLICFVCYLPYFLYEYPGIMTADSIVQYEQIIGAIPWSNHHPVIHTLLISLFYHIGVWVTGNINVGIAVYTIAQMLFMCFCCGSMVWTVLKITGSKKAAVLAECFFALVPYNAVFAVTVWKDVPFAGLVMLLSCHLVNMAADDENKVTDWLLLGILLIFISLFRSNGWYAFILFIPFGLWVFRKQLKKALVTFAIAVIAVIIVKGPVMTAFSVGMPDFTESLSLPLQQVARVLVDDKTIDDSDMKLIEAVIDTTYIHQLYAPDFADNIKELVRAGHPEVIENNKGAYLSLWVRLFFKYPAEYIKAWFDLEGGYVYSDISYEVGNIDGIMGNDYGLVSTPLIGGKAVIKSKEIFIKLGNFVPLYGMLWSAGTYFWLLLFSLVVILRDKNRRKAAVICVLPLALILTLLIAAPVVDFRYAYPAVMTMPLYISICGMIIQNDKIRR